MAKQPPTMPVTKLRPGETPRPDPLIDARVDALNELDQVRAAISTVAGQLVAARGGQPLCKDGCGLCCTVNTPMMSGLEAALTVGKLQVSDDARQRARDWLLEKHSGVTLYADETPAVFGGDAIRNFSPEQHEQLERERMTLSTQRCPFLRSDMGCALYEGRPLACRMYGLGVVPDPYCERPLDVHEVLTGKRSFDRSFGEAVEDYVDDLHRRAARADVSFGRAGFAPMMIYAVAERADFERMVASGQVALAKLGVLREGQRYPGILSQRRREAYRTVLQARQPGYMAPVPVR